MSEDQRPACACGWGEAELAATVIRRSVMTDDLVDDSHFHVTLRRCGICGRRLVRVFCELIDWTEGDDSQAWITAEITDDEAEMLRAAAQSGAGPLEQAIAALPPRRVLYDVHPRGGTRGQNWREGPIVVLPHD